MKRSKIIWVVMLFAAVVAGGYFIAAHYLNPEPVVQNPPVTDNQNALTPEEQQALLDRFSNPSGTSSNNSNSSESKALSEGEKDEFIQGNGSASSSPPLTEEQRKEFSNGR